MVVAYIFEWKRILTLKALSTNTNSIKIRRSGQNRLVCAWSLIVPRRYFRRDPFYRKFQFPKRPSSAAFYLNTQLESAGMFHTFLEVHMNELFFEVLRGHENNSSRFLSHLQNLDVQSMVKNVFLCIISNILGSYTLGIFSFRAQLPKQILYIKKNP